MELSEATVAVLCEDLYQELELWYPLLRVRETGASVFTVGPKPGAVCTSRLGYPIVSDFSSAEVDADDFDAVIIPGGQSPERMRRNADTLDFVRKLDQRGAIVAAICHAGWVLASAGIAGGRRLTCASFIKDDVIHAGADYVDEAVVVDANLITSRYPDDLPAFAAAVIDSLEAAPDRTSKPALGLPRSSPSYTLLAQLVPVPAGVASANYRTATSFATLG